MGLWCIYCAERKDNCTSFAQCPLCPVVQAEIKRHHSDIKVRRKENIQYLQLVIKIIQILYMTDDMLHFSEQLSIGILSRSPKYPI